MCCRENAVTAERPVGVSEQLWQNVQRKVFSDPPPSKGVWRRTAIPVRGVFETVQAQRIAQVAHLLGPQRRLRVGRR